MALLLLAALWILSLCVVVALCRAARLGELEPSREELPHAVSDQPPTAHSLTAVAASRRHERASTQTVQAGGAAG
jgi:hypothetical protein